MNELLFYQAMKSYMHERSANQARRPKAPPRAHPIHSLRQWLRRWLAPVIRPANQARPLPPRWSSQGDTPRRAA